MNAHASRKVIWVPAFEEKQRENERKRRAAADEARARAERHFDAQLERIKRGENRLIALAMALLAAVAAFLL